VLTKNKSWSKSHAAVDGKGNIVASEITSNMKLLALDPSSVVAIPVIQSFDKIISRC
jgi:hypothetical protein